jgi:hypothetical protein
VSPKEEREADLRDLDAAELDASRNLPLTAAGPTVTLSKGPSARSSMKQMPDEAATSPGIDTLDCNAKAP